MFYYQKTYQKAFFLVMLFFVFFNQKNLLAQEKYTISGYIKDAKNGETLIGAQITLKEVGYSTASNSYGFYSLTAPQGTYTIEISYVGYKPFSQNLELSKNETLAIELSEDAELEAIEVTSELDIAKSTEMSVNKLDMKTVSRVPALLGEVDLVRAIQLLPGVSTVGEGATGFNVRGGGVDQNLVLLDEAPVFNSSHLFGFFSIFNPDAVKDVKLIKGGIPAQYGGRLSSILDVRLKEGNNKKFSASGGVGLIFSRLTIEAPIKKDKGSFIIAARRSYIDILAKPFLSGDLASSVFNFYDLTMKANYELGKKDKIFLSGYFGRDNFSASNAFKSNWGNATATFRWNHLFNDKLFLNFTTFYSNYDYKLGFGTGKDTFDWKSRIVNYSVKPEFSWFLNDKNTITFGGQTIYYDFSPGNAVGVSAGQSTDISLPNKYALESALYIANEQVINSKLSLQYGLRFSLFNYLGAGDYYTFDNNVPIGTRKPVTQTFTAKSNESIQNYNNWEPRASFKYQLNEYSSIKGSYNRMVQYLHLISNTTASTPLDVWTPSTNNIKPQLADQYAIGYFRTFKSGEYEFSAETYYKDIQNLVDYVDGADLLLNKFLEGELITGKGRAYGIELFLKKNKGKFTGWVSYTLARTERQVQGINRGEWYPNRYDQTHRLNVVALYDLNERWSFSADFVISSGTPATFPTSRFAVQGYNAIPQNPNETRNNVRIPWYHRFDMSATLQGRKVKRNGKPRKNQDYWVFSVYNTYGRRNPFSIYFRQNDQNQAVTESVRFSVIGTIIPSVSYNFKF